MHDMVKVKDKEFRWVTYMFLSYFIDSVFHQKRIGRANINAKHVTIYVPFSDDEKEKNKRKIVQRQMKNCRNKKMRVFFQQKLT